MNKKSIILLSIVLGISIWLIDAIVDFFLFYDGEIEKILTYEHFIKEAYLFFLIVIPWIVFGFILTKIILKRKQAEVALKLEIEKEQRYLDIAGVMFVALDENEKVTLINKKGCHILGYKEEEILDHNWFDFFIPQIDREKVRSIYKRIMAAEIGATDYFENKILTKNGCEKIIAWHNIILRDSKGKVVGSLSSGTDITQQKSAEVALKKALNDLEQQNKELKSLDKMKDSLIRDVSHELKTPVAKQKMHLEMLKMILGKNIVSDKYEHIIKVMESTVRRQEKYIHNILDLARLKAGGREYVKEPMRLDLVIENVLDDYQANCETHGIKIEKNLEAITIISDEEMLFNVFSNLINNAIKYRSQSDEPRLGIFQERRNGKVITKIVDNGVGISKNEESKVFSSFYRASKNADGSGVGLTITKTIVEDLGGRITLSSNGAGQGVTAIVELPYHEQERDTGIV